MALVYIAMYVLAQAHTVPCIGIVSFYSRTHADTQTQTQYTHVQTVWHKTQVQGIKSLIIVPTDSQKHNTSFYTALTRFASVASRLNHHLFSLPSPYLPLLAFFLLRGHYVEYTESIISE